METNSTTVSVRIATESKKHLNEVAALHGMKLSDFIKMALDEKVNRVESVKLDDCIRNQIQLIRQIVFFGFSWQGDELLIKKEVDRLCEMIENASQ